MQPVGCRRDRGAAALEMALVLPMLLLLLFGIIDFGWLFCSKVALSNAAREGVRIAAVQGTRAQASTRVNASMSGATIVSFTGCPNPAGVAEVHVAAAFQAPVPLGPLSRMLGADGSATDGAGTISDSGSMRCEG